MHPLFDRQAIREAELGWAERMGQPTFELMQSAARAIADRATQCLDPRHPVTVLCGRGNNGGDGLLAGALLARAGWTVRFWLSGEPDPPSDAHRARQLARAADVPFLDTLADLPSHQIIDALLGTGFSGAPRGRIAEAMQWAVSAARSGCPVLAVDCPSGLNTDTGHAGLAVPAQNTVSFIGLKPGLLTGLGPALCGRVHPVDLSAAPSPDQATAWLVRPDALSWPERSTVAHKGDFGHVWVIGGGPGMPGAAALAAESALVSGAGRVSALTAPDNRLLITQRAPEVMVPAGLPPEPALGSVLVVGPGLGRDNAAAERFRTALEWAAQGSCPMVLDADALWHLAAAPTRLPNGVLTPHPGEAARLLGETVAGIEQDRLSAARELQRRFGGVVILKGAGTLIAGPETLYLVEGAHGAMATSGLGDVLSGLTGALLAQGMAPQTAAIGAVCALVDTGYRVARDVPVARASAVVAQLPTRLYRLGLRSHSITRLD